MGRVWGGGGSRGPILLLQTTVTHILDNILLISALKS